jgi:predicted DNA-binding antitoxin AbrB/MazE fold protein
LARLRRALERGQTGLRPRATRAASRAGGYQKYAASSATAVRTRYFTSQGCQKSGEGGEGRTAASLLAGPRTYNKEVMPKQVEAVYENGVLRPSEPLLLREHQRVTVTIAEGVDDPLAALLDIEYLERVRGEVATLDRIPTIEEVRAATAKDGGSWSELIVAEREDRF